MSCCDSSTRSIPVADCLQVEYVEHDSVVQALDVQPASLEGNAPWGLARISHRTALTLGTFSKYLYAGEGGEGVDVYVIDTGTNIQHVDFEGRASWGKTIPSGDPDEDGNGHGTHCSGTIGGKIYGVAKKASIIAIKVLRSNGSGSMSDVVKGVEFAAESHLDRVALAKQGKGKKGFKGSAANMSLGGGKSVTLDAAVNAAVEAGIHFAVAAGNDNADACKYSPAAADKCVTVGASTLADERAYFSNFGKCVDIFAPGLNIKSTWIGSKYATNVISGTSMASPHIAGLLAYYLSLQPSNSSAFAVDSVTPKQLKENVIAAASKNKLSGIPSGTVNLLAWNGAGSSNLSAIFGDHDTADSVSMRQQAQSEKSAMRAEMVRMDQEADRIVHELQKEGEYRIAQAEEKFAEIEDIIDEKMLQILEEVQAVVMA